MFGIDSENIHHYVSRNTYNVLGKYVRNLMIEPYYMEFTFDHKNDVQGTNFHADISNGDYDSFLNPLTKPKLILFGYYHFSLYFTLDSVRAPFTYELRNYIASDLVTPKISTFWFGHQESIQNHVINFESALVMSNGFASFMPEALGPDKVRVSGSFTGWRGVYD